MSAGKVVFQPITGRVPYGPGPPSLSARQIPPHPSPQSGKTNLHPATSPTNFPASGPKDMSSIAPHPKSPRQPKSAVGQVNAVTYGGSNQPVQFQEGGNVRNHTIAGSLKQPVSPTSKESHKTGRMPHHKRTVPKYVPHEPYKGAVSSREGETQQKRAITRNRSQDHLYKIPINIPNIVRSKGKSALNAPPTDDGNTNAKSSSEGNTDRSGAQSGSNESVVLGIEASGDLQGKPGEKEARLDQPSKSIKKRLPSDSDSQNYGNVDIQLGLESDGQQQEWFRNKGIVKANNAAYLVSIDDDGDELDGYGRSMSDVNYGLFGRNTSRNSKTSPPEGKAQPIVNGKPINRVDPLKAASDPSSSVAIDMLENDANLEGQLRSQVAIEDEEHYRTERKELKMQLDSLVKVNADLKRLLVASMGNDLEYKVESLARDKAQLDTELGHYQNRVHQDYEDLDRLSIQADMWRSKFMASKVMVDELASWKAHLFMKYQESHNALQEILKERQELREYLTQTHRGLAIVKDAFNPAAQKTRLCTSSNVLTLSKENHLLADTVRFRLLGTCTSLHNVAIEMTPEQDDLTPAERLAQEIISQQEDSVDAKVPPSLRAKPVADRWHPSSRSEKITVNCCANCKGELMVV